MSLYQIDDILEINLTKHKKDLKIVLFTFNGHFKSNLLFIYFDVGETKTSYLLQCLK